MYMNSNLIVIYSSVSGRGDPRIRHDCRRAPAEDLVWGQTKGRSLHVSSLWLDKGKLSEEKALVTYIVC